MTLYTRLVAYYIYLFGIFKAFYLACLHINRNINKHRTRTACRSYMESLLENLWKLCGILYKIAVLYEGFTRTCNICLLEYISAEQVALYLTCYSNERNRVHISCCDTCYHIQSAGTGCCDTDADC